MTKCIVLALALNNTECFVLREYACLLKVVQCCVGIIFNQVKRLARVSYYKGIDSKITECI
jgi:hypothetical protein